MAMKFFRKHQKVILACITIGTMFLFIVGDALTMGSRGPGGRKGGFINWVRNLFSGAPDDAVAVIQGSAYDPDQLADLAQTRALAFQFVTQLMSEAQVEYMRSLGLTEEDMRDPQKARQKQEEILAKDPSKNEPLTRRMSSLVVQAIRTTSPLITDFRGNTTYPPAEAQVDFLLFKNKADTLGVTVTTASIKDDLVSVVGMNQLTESQLTSLARAMSRRPGAQGGRALTKLDDFLSVLADEVRVAMALSVIQGDMNPPSQFSFMGSSPADLTPSDLWNSYVKVKTSLTVGIAPFKTENYVNQVKDPTQDEALAYFEKYKKDYPDPEKDTPGFRIPPTYRVGFLYGDLTEGKPTRKHYNALVDANDHFAYFAVLSDLVARGATPAAAVLTTCVPRGPLAELVADYNAKKLTVYRQQQSFVEFAVTGKAGAPWVRVYRPYAKFDQAAAASLVASAGSALAQANALVPFDLFTMTEPLRGQSVPPAQNELINVASAFGSALGAANLPGTVLAPPKVREGQEDIFVPFNVVAGVLMDQRYERESRKLLDRDLAEVTDQLREYAKHYSEWRGKVLRKTAPANQPPFFNEATKQTLQAYLTKFAAARGLEYHETKDLRSRVDLLNEPGDRLLNTFLKPLYAHESLKTRRELEDRVKNMLVGNEIGGGQRPRLYEATNTAFMAFKPNSKQLALHWVAEMSDARTPTFDEARPAVVRAWKLEHARPVAEQAAQDFIKNLTKKLKDNPNTPRQDTVRLLNDLPGYTPGQSIAQFREPVLQATSPGISYERCPIPETIDFPPADLVQQCLDKLKQDGDLTVLPNQPKDTYYLFYLSHRSEPTLSNPLDLERFHTEVLRTSVTRPFTVNGSPFKTFAAAERVTSEQKSWDQYVKALTNFNDARGKEYMDRLRQRY